MNYGLTWITTSCDEFSCFLKCPKLLNQNLIYKKINNENLVDFTLNLLIPFLPSSSCIFLPVSVLWLSLLQVFPEELWHLRKSVKSSHLSASYAKLIIRASVLYHNKNEGQLFLYNIHAYFRFLDLLFLLFFNKTIFMYII